MGKLSEFAIFGFELEKELTVYKIKFYNIQAFKLSSSFQVTWFKKTP